MATLNGLLRRSAPGAHSPEVVRKQRLFFGGAVVLALILIMGADPAALETVPSQTPDNPMDTPLRLIGDAQQVYQRVTTYTCQFRKRERLRGQMQAENVITMAVRTQPFSVYLNWQTPAALAGQEACYVAGANDGMMRAHSTGVLGVVGFVSLDPRDPRCLEHSRHDITEAGIGNLIARFRKGWDRERQLNRTQVQIAEFDYARRRCIRVETIHPDNRGGEYTYYRSLVYFDKETRLPIRVENYDWPKRGGDPRGDLLECYSYVDMRFNVNLPESTFAR
jgi:hypothetical protein